MGAPKDGIHFEDVNLKGRGAAVQYGQSKLVSTSSGWLCSLVFLSEEAVIRALYSSPRNLTGGMATLVSCLCPRIQEASERGFIETLQA
jgi:hypothetical protein